MILHIGFDDTDSPRTGCTTYIAALIIDKMRKIGVSFIDYPNLIRLNPNVPWKTRGNGALCLRIQFEERLFRAIKECVINIVEENADLDHKGTDPGIVFLTGDISSEVEAFAEKTINGLVQKDEALHLIKKCKAEAICFKKGRGVIGGLAAIGERLKADHTYEFIAYRMPENRGSLRRVDISSVVRMDRQLGHMSFANIDPERGRILITPRGPDPILYGIRGETPEVVRQGHDLILPEEPIERWAIFRTNQGTDAHLKRIVSISEVKPYNPVIIQGEITEKPHVIQGGHIILRIKDKTGKIDCAAYEPTGVLHKAVRALASGDIIEVYGGVCPASQRHPVTLNIEKIRIIQLVPTFKMINPLCPFCGKRTKSIGRGQGFECEKCGFHGRNFKKDIHEVEREIMKGIYITSPRSQRHLTKPLSRYGLEKAESSNNYDNVIPYDLFYGS